MEMIVLYGEISVKHHKVYHIVYTDNKVTCVVINTTRGCLKTLELC